MLEKGNRIDYINLCIPRLLLFLNFIFIMFYSNLLQQQYNNTTIQLSFTGYRAILYFLIVYYSSTFNVEKHSFTKGGDNIKNKFSVSPLMLPVNSDLISLGFPKTNTVHYLGGGTNCFPLHKHNTHPVIVLSALHSHTH